MPCSSMMVRFVSMQPTQPYLHYAHITPSSAAAPQVKTEPLNDIEKTLNAIGVKYTHRNDDLIAESNIEGQRMQKLIEVRIIR